jgi:hypothetical protein
MIKMREFNMEISAVTFVTIFAIIGLLALLVSVITEVTKGVALLSKIPVDLQVIILSLTLTIITYFAYISYTGDAIIWYCVAATIVAGFVVAYVVLYGWDKFIELYKRFRNIPPIDITVDSLPKTASEETTNTSPITNVLDDNRFINQDSEQDKPLE